LHKPTNGITGLVSLLPLAIELLIALIVITRPNNSANKSNSKNTKEIKCKITNEIIDKAISKKAIENKFAVIHKTQATQTTQRSITSPTASYYMHLDTRVAASRNDSLYDACDIRNISYPQLVLISACDRTAKCCCY
jgi:hypothetical protein